MPQLILNNISYSVHAENNSQKHSEKIILKDISFEIDHGKILGIAGESGSGKTTLVKIIAGINSPTKGSMIFHKSKNWGDIKTSPIQILFQNNGEILNPYREIYKIVEEAYSIRFGKTQSSSQGTDYKSVSVAEDLSRQSEPVEDYISKDKSHFDKLNVTEKLVQQHSRQGSVVQIFNLLNFSESLWHRKGYELSGGEQQRAALARILITQPELLILDEPFSAQDPESQLNLLNLFKKINEQFNLTMICIAHNLKILQKLADEIIIMYKGEIVERGETKNIFQNPQHPYTKLLLKAEEYNLTLNELRNFSF